MAPKTILIVGATGNTGRMVTEILSQNSQTLAHLKEYRLLALTRSTSSAVAQKLAKLPNVTFEEKKWPEIDGDWLRERNVVKAFIASHNLPPHFAEESTFHVAALRAGVKYVVRISTTAANWSSLQPNVFFTFTIPPAVEFVKNFRKAGKQGKLALLLDEKAEVGVVDADDVGRFAAALLSAEDHSIHNKKKYVLNGPDDVTGRGIVDLVEKEIGVKVENVKYRDLDFLEQMAASSPEPHLIQSIKYAPVTGWNGECSVATTSKEVYELAAPQTTAADWFQNALKNHG
ncbi:NAD(P)-binding Rossmann-fold containing protein [Glarea lozoyensis ATCC 20868]|uniref:NAD(P)-binding Rossmann-fold containing protein n=1 Tax=Glarea lozoyensis (strain ATCC 20868 / MF5171) TaxID=1116229 RepID=S3DK99_GLAL2|nr:NAD(P)-binding Rossmann-fold containing protein [Glarea lozoyensis ATCC 20868]EPE32486.1 NAD(P)-binding Rossmann-fold containing protein [Glarea lozoyensis ATCC 20868]